MGLKSFLKGKGWKPKVEVFDPEASPKPVVRSDRLGNRGIVDPLVAELTAEVAQEKNHPVRPHAKAVNATVVKTEASKSSRPALPASPTAVADPNDSDPFNIHLDDGTSSSMQGDVISLTDSFASAASESFSGSGTGSGIMRLNDTHANSSAAAYSFSHRYTDDTSKGLSKLLSDTFGDVAYAEFAERNHLKDHEGILAAAHSFADKKNALGKEMADSLATGDNDAYLINVPSSFPRAKLTEIGIDADTASNLPRIGKTVRWNVPVKVMEEEFHEIKTKEDLVNVQRDIRAHEGLERAIVRSVTFMGEKEFAIDNIPYNSDPDHIFPSPLPSEIFHHNADKVSRQMRSTIVVPKNIAEAIVRSAESSKETQPAATAR